MKYGWVNKDSAALREARKELAPRRQAMSLLAEALINACNQQRDD